ncbi:MAG: amidohydrolase family protein [Acidobacteria bacterium]|nr:amidohydrolase family protein [Acidobacteriota bacterium]
MAAALLERAFDLGFRGLKLHLVSTIAHPGLEETLQLVRIAALHNAPTLFHCGDEPMIPPLAVSRAAQAAPDATIILGGHMGGYFHVGEAIEVARRVPNLVLETSAMPYPAKIREAVDAIGAERVLYGSDGPVCSPRLEVRNVRLAALRASDEELVLAGNAMRILQAVR